MQTEQVLLTYLLAESIDDNLSFPARAVLQKSLSDLKKYIGSKQKLNPDEMLSAHYLLALERMKAPEKARPTIHKEIPPGSPIGCEEDY